MFWCILLSIFCKCFVYFVLLQSKHVGLWLPHFYMHTLYMCWWFCGSQLLSHLFIFCPQEVNQKATNNTSQGSEFDGVLHSAHLAQLFIRKEEGRLLAATLGKWLRLQSTERRRIQLERALVIFMLSVTVREFPC